MEKNVRRLEEILEFNKSFVENKEINSTET